MYKEPSDASSKVLDTPDLGNGQKEITHPVLINEVEA